MEDIKDTAPSELSVAEAKDANEKAGKETEITQKELTEAKDAGIAPAETKPKARKKAATKSADSDTTANPSDEKKATRKRTTAKKVSASLENSEEATATLTEQDTENINPENKDTAKSSEEPTSVSESIDSTDDASHKASTVSNDNITEQTESPLKPSEEKDTEDCGEDKSQISFFSISTADFDAAYSEIENSSETVILPEDEKEEEEIIPPDELFAYRSTPQEEITETPSDEDSEYSDTVVDTEDTEHEESIDEDGQYHFSNLDTLPSQKKEKSEPTLDKYDPKKPRKIDGRFDIIELFVFTLLAVMILTTFFFRHSIVEGASMENTLHSGEHLIISDFFYTPKRGDIIVCEDYTTSIKKPIVKRVIAIEGDVITITPDKRVYVNGELLDESNYVYVNGIDFTKPIYDFEVPENEIFVMGDHRNDSEDSRSIGTISEDAVLGKVILRFYPFDKFGTVK